MKSQKECKRLLDEAEARLEGIVNNEERMVLRWVREAFEVDVETYDEPHYSGLPPATALDKMMEEKVLVPMMKRVLTQSPLIDILRDEIKEREASK